jgi:hypothetical protein
MFKVEANNLPCLVVGNFEYHEKYDNVIGIYSKSQEILLLEIKDNIYKLEFEDEYMIQNPRYFIFDKLYFIECNKNGKIIKRMNEYCLLNFYFNKEIQLPRIPYEFEKLLNLDNKILQKEIDRLKIGKEINLLQDENDINLINIELIQHYWQKIIYKRLKNKNYEYNGMLIEYFNFIQ